MQVCHISTLQRPKVFQIKHVNQVLVLCPSCVPEKVGVNQKGINQK
jgi:hypothetical protein